MTVQELIAILQRFTPTQRIVLQGGQGGLEDIEQIGEHWIKLHVNTHSIYLGPHELWPPAEADECAYVLERWTP